MEHKGKPLLVEIVAYAPTAYYHCTHCEVAFREMGMSNHFHDEQVGSSLPPDLAQDYQRLSDWVRDLFRVHCDRLVVSVVDAASVQGVWLALRYGLRRYPAILVDRRLHFSGGDFAHARQAIDHLLTLTPAASGGELRQ